jgi:predicted nuclease of predicted toxin-antitoxin system
MAGTAANGIFVRLYIDADISYKLAQALRGRGFDAMAAHEVGMAEASDDEQMAYAAAEGRAILTCNAQDFTPIFRDYWRNQRSHNGVIVSEQLGLGEMLRRVIKFLNSVAADEMINNWKNLAEFATRAE